MTFSATHQTYMSPTSPAAEVDSFLQNFAERQVVPRSSQKWTIQDKTAIQSGVLGQEELGRIKQADVQSELVEEDSVHS
jgi:hypothetical protein